MLTSGAQIKALDEAHYERIVLGQLQFQLQLQFELQL